VVVVHAMGKTRDFADIFGFYKVLHSPICKGSGARGEPGDGVGILHITVLWMETMSPWVYFLLLWMSHHPCGSLHALSIGLVFLLTAFLGHRHLAAVAIAAGRFICGSRVLNQRCGVIQSNRDVGQVCAKGKHFFG